MSGPLLLPTWEQLEATHPRMVATMRAYLDQVACVLRPGSVAGADLALHGHAHDGVEHGMTAGGTRVRNVAMPVIRSGYRVYELDPALSVVS